MFFFPGELFVNQNVESDYNHFLALEDAQRKAKKVLTFQLRFFFTFLIHGLRPLVTVVKNL